MVLLLICITETLKNFHYYYYYRYRKEQKYDFLERLSRIEACMEDMNRRIYEMQMKIEYIFKFMGRGSPPYSEGEAGNDWNQDLELLGQYFCQQNYS